MARHPDFAYFEKSTRDPDPNTWKFPRLAVRKPKPLEGGPWRRFFHELEYVNRPATDEEKKYCDTAINLTKKTFRKKHFLSKNPSHCLRIKWLFSMYPDAKFIILHRDRNATLQSLWAYAKKNWERDYNRKHDYEHGFEGWVTINDFFGGGRMRLHHSSIVSYHDYMKQKQLVDSSDVLPTMQKFDVTYEQFCAYPQQTLNELFDFCNMPRCERIRGLEIRNMNGRHTRHNSVQTR